jgi:hypothetical protein
MGYIPQFNIVPASKYAKIQPLIEAQRANYVIVNDAYINSFNRPERYQPLYGGAGSGKSDFKGTDLLIKAMIKPFFRLLYCRKNSTEIRDSQFSLFKDIIERQNWQQYFDYSTSKSGSMEIVCKLNGNRLIPHGLDNVHKLTSIHDITDVWLEEPLSKTASGGHITEDDFTELDRRLRTSKASCHIHFTFNPIGTQNWIYECFFDKDNKKNERYPLYLPKTYTLKTTFKDNVFIDQDEEESKFRMQGSYAYQVYGLGNWGYLKARDPFIYEFKMEKHVGRVVFNKDKPFYLAIDFNLGKMAATIWQINLERKAVFCVHEFDPCVGLDDRINSILSSPFLPYLDYCYLTGDSTGQARDQKTPHMTHYEYMKKKLNLGASQLKVAKANMHHKNSKQLCNYIIRNYDFCIDEKCVNLINDCMTCEDNGEDGIDKKTLDPHWLDGMRYFFQNILAHRIEYETKR